MVAPKQSAEEIELAQEEAGLRAEAESISPPRPEDAAIPDVPSEAEERAAATGDRTPQKSERTGTDKKPAATGTDTPAASKEKSNTAQTAAKPETTPKPGDKAPTVDESKLTPFQRERHRLDKSWQTLKAERETIAREREQLAAQQRTIAEQQQQRQTATPKRSDGLTADDFDQVAKDYEAEGKLALAKAAKEKAAELRQQDSGRTPGATGPNRERFSPEEVQTMTQQWQANLEKAGKENPELTQENSPLRARVAELLKTTPLLHQSGDGILHAVAYAKAELRAKQADELQTKVTELEAEIQRLTGLTSLPSGGAVPTGSAKKFEELTLDEQERELRNEAAGGSGD